MRFVLYIISRGRRAFGLQFLFGLANACDFGIGIDNARNGLVAHAAVLAKKYDRQPLPLR